MALGPFLKFCDLESRVMAIASKFSDFFDTFTVKNFRV